MYWNPLLVICLLAQSSYALGIHQRFDVGDAATRTHERRIAHDANSWVDSRKLEDTTLVPLRIALKQQNLHTLSDHLISVSDPGSSAYGQHWSHQDLIEAFSPSRNAHDTVKAWLLNAGFKEKQMKVSYNKAWLEVQGATVAEVERLLGTEYRVFKNANGDENAACHDYSLPLEVAEHIDFVIPTVQPNVKIVKVPIRQTIQPLSERDINITSNAANVSNSNVLSGCDTRIVPSCLKALYNMTYTPKMATNNSVGVVSYYSNGYLQSDLDLFFGNFSPALVGSSPTLVSIDGGTIALDDSSSVGEDDWILSYLMTLSDSPQSVQFLQIGSQQTGSFFSINEWLDAVDGSYCTSDGGDDLAFDPQFPNPFPGGFNDHTCGTVKAPHVISASQAVEEIAYTGFYKQRQCNEFAKLGLMGVTVLYSAGNIGVASTQRRYCIDDNGSITLNGTHFSPSWPASCPASCPWVTAVGGTQVKSNATLGRNPEEVWNQDMTMGFFVSSGGGFSQTFSQPAYQKNAVLNYLNFLAKDDPTTLKHFNNHGRAYPDISASANSFFHFENGNGELDSGTSGAVPTIASVITLVNDARLAAGKKPVGFINPTIYSPAFADAFNDVVDGTSAGCKGLQGVRTGGFRATKGWDAATGVGSPNLGKLIEKWLQLP